MLIHESRLVLTMFVGLIDRSCIEYFSCKKVSLRGKKNRIDDYNLKKNIIWCIAILNMNPVIDFLHHFLVRSLIGFVFSRYNQNK
jgi:hypothetical protein